MILAIYTIFHVVISLAAIGSGLAVVGMWIRGASRKSWESFFLWSTVATSVTGFFFPFHGFKPSYVVGIISLIILTLAIQARKRFNRDGGWRKTYVISSVLALYLNVFVLIVQSFLKVPALHALAPTQNEPPFKIAQRVVLILFIVFGIVSAKHFQAQPAEQRAAQ